MLPRRGIAATFLSRSRTVPGRGRRRPFALSGALIALLLGLALTLPPAPARADFKGGAEAYSRGDFAAAKEAWRPLAEAGDAQAQYNLGYMHFNGIGGPENFAEAARWYRLAAEQGDPNAQLNLGNLYAEGKGTVQNYREAYFWFALAANGLPEGIDREQAINNREIAGAHLSQRQVREVLSRALMWEPTEKKGTVAQSDREASEADDDGGEEQSLMAKVLHFALPALELGNEDESENGPPLPQAKPPAIAADVGVVSKTSQAQMVAVGTQIAAKPADSGEGLRPAGLTAASADESDSAFLVQLAAMKSASEAEKEWKRLQTTFPAILGSRDLLLEKGDLGDKGVYYRVRVGPLEATDARALCRELSTRDQSCLVIPKAALPVKGSSRQDQPRTQSLHGLARK